MLLLLFNIHLLLHNSHLSQKFVNTNSTEWSQITSDLENCLKLDFNACFLILYFNKVHLRFFKRIL